MENKVIMTSCIVPLIFTIILLFKTNKFTNISYSLVYAFFMEFIIIIRSIKTLKLTNNKIVNKNNIIESYVLMELFLGLGRITSFMLLLIVGLLKIDILLYIVILFISICTIFEGRCLAKINIE